MGIGFQGPKGELGLPGTQGPPGPRGEGAPLISKGEAIVGPPGDKGQRGEKVGVDVDDNLSISANYYTFIHEFLPRVAVQLRYMLYGNSVCLSIVYCVQTTYCFMK